MAVVVPLLSVAALVGRSRCRDKREVAKHARKDGECALTYFAESMLHRIVGSHSSLTNKHGLFKTGSKTALLRIFWHMKNKVKGRIHPTPNKKKQKKKTFWSATRELSKEY